MEKLISELMRLYLPAGFSSPERLARHLLGQEPLAVGTEGGATRVIAIAFDKRGDGDNGRHWTELCEMASVLQVQYGFPAPAVSISGADGYRLWMSLKAPAPVAEVRQFLELLGQVHFPESPVRFNVDAGLVTLPPCLNAVTGKWAAFINPGMGASFIEEPGLEVAPPLAAQAGFLEGLKSIDLAQFRQVLSALSVAPEAAQLTARSTPDGAVEGVLLREATLEDIVRYLHAKNIEPTFRHLIRND